MNLNLNSFLKKYFNIFWFTYKYWFHLYGYILFWNESTFSDFLILSRFKFLTHWITINNNLKIKKFKATFFFISNICFKKILYKYYVFFRIHAAVDEVNQPVSRSYDQNKSYSIRIYIHFYILPNNHLEQSLQGLTKVPLGYGLETNSMKVQYFVFRQDSISFIVYNIFDSINLLNFRQKCLLYLNSIEISISLQASFLNVNYKTCSLEKHYRKKNWGRLKFLIISK